MNKIEEITIEATKAWENVGMLVGIEDNYVKSQIAVMLENQRLINQGASDSNVQFNRASIPLVRRVFNPHHCLIWDLVSLQVMIGPMMTAFFDLPEGETSWKVAAKTKRLKSVFQIEHDLDKEYEMIAKLATEIINEINTEVIEDLRRNFGFGKTITWQSPETLKEELVSLFSYFKNGTSEKRSTPFGKKPNWVVTGASLAVELKKVFDFEPLTTHDSENLTCLHTGTLNKEIKLIECNLFPNQILVGRKGDSFDSGYIYAPYVPFTVHENHIFTRYGKRLQDSRYYASLTVNGFEKIN